jgi:hypothetical protein
MELVSYFKLFMTGRSFCCSQARSLKDENYKSNLGKTMFSSAEGPVDMLLQKIRPSTLWSWILFYCCDLICVCISAGTTATFTLDLFYFAFPCQTFLFCLWKYLAIKNL